MNFDSSIPIYLQIIDLYKKEMLKGKIKMGDKILSQREFAKKYKVNPNTVQRAYREMERMNLVKTLRGQGTFINANRDMIRHMKVERARQHLKNFIDEMNSLGYKKTDVIELIDKYWWEGEDNDTV